MPDEDLETAAPAEAEADATAADAPTMEWITALVVLGFGVAMLLGARGIDVRNETGGIDPRWWPTVVAAGIVGCGVWMLINALLRRQIDRDVEPSRRSGWIQTVVTVVLIIVVLATWELGISFLVLGPLFLVVINWVYGLRTWASLLLFPGIVAGLLYTVFQLLLKVPL